MAAQNEFVKDIADIDSDFPQWYTDVVLKAKLADYGPVKGTMVIRPYGYAVWEHIQAQMDARIKATGHENAYFPLLIPYGFLQKEAEHVEGFAPEVALVTHVGDTPLTEKLAVRPTSETIICDMYSRWVQSYRDLPLLINQWANVVRWEKTTRPFLRTSEFLWQEGHTVHATAAEAEEETIKMLNVYAEFSKNVLAIPMLCGKKSEKEKFAGAQDTYSIEAMMRDGKSLQAGTSHNLGQNFSKAFGIKFLDKDGEHKFAYQTSWGTTTRLIGALIMVHGDGRGLFLPPAVAPVQTAVIPIAVHKPGVIEGSRALCAELASAGIRAKIDESDNSPGWKFNECEMKGVPLRLELGPRDIENGVVTAVRRDKIGEKLTLQRQNIAPCVADILQDIHSGMYERAEKNLISRIRTAHNLSEMKKALDDGCFALSMWCGDPACERAVKEKMQGSSRNMPFDQTPVGERCAVCGRPAKYKIYFARAY
ncbi:MAG: proline--tRNA ligase [Clostridiales bacterium]|jgi:prolyl-tRNA synthetase|nr:proline--tRNA ligase [Clostridiales bacterium]